MNEYAKWLGTMVGKATVFLKTTFEECGCEEKVSLKMAPEKKERSERKPAWAVNAETASEPAPVEETPALKKTEESAPLETLVEQASTEGTETSLESVTEEDSGDGDEAGPDGDDSPSGGDPNRQGRRRKKGRRH